MPIKTNFSLKGYNYSEIPIVEIKTPLVETAGLCLLVKREDLIHPEVSGNKWRKLKYNLIEAEIQNCSTLLTFGGAYSNHIFATAAAGKIFNFKTIGIIRGEKPKKLNPTLQYAKETGMQFHFVSRSDYRDKKSLLTRLPINTASIYVLPEGGTNSLAMKGCSEMVKETDNHSNIDYWCVACGTGGTLAGMITTLLPGQKAIGFSVLKGDFLKEEIENLLLAYDDSAYDNWSVNTDYHFGGYAKFDENLIRFINEFKRTHQIRLDPIYTGKMFYGIFDLIKKDHFQRGSTIMAIHTGGQQGIAGFNQRFGNLLE